MPRLMWPILATCLAILAGGVTAAYIYEQPTTVRVAVTRDSDDYRMMAAEAQAMVRDRQSVRLKLVPAADPAQAASLLDNDKVELAVVRSDIQLSQKGLTAVILHRSAAILMVPVDSDIKAIGDLAGKRIGVLRGAPGSGSNNTRLLDVILTQHDIKAADVTATIMNEGDLRDALKARTVDAVLAVGAPSSRWLSDAAAAVATAGGGAPTFLEVGDAKAISQHSPAFEPIEVVQGTFGVGRPADDLDTLSVSTRLMARTSMDDNLVGEVTRAMFAERRAIADTNPLANGMEAPSTDKDAPLPTHPGAAAYLDGDQQTFMDRYSDFIYIGAMVLSVLGSGAAALASRMGFSNSARAETRLARILEILSMVRDAKTTAELDGLQHEADALLVSSLDQGAFRGLDSHHLSALGLAIDQVRHAVSDRRILLATTNVVPFEAPRIASLAE